MSDPTRTIQALEARIRELDDQNRRLATEAQEVANANVNAAMQLVELSEARARDLETKNAEIVAALRIVEEVSLQKSRFLANMGHELRTPISGILGLAELLADGDLNRLQREHIEAIASTADSFLELINQLLDFSKAEAGKIQLEHIRFDLWATIESVGQLLQVRADQRDIDLLLRLDPALPRTALGDPLRLRQILLNLGTNAVKFTERGVVLLEANACTMPTGEPGLEVRLVDTGCGFSAEVGRRLFEPFMQADASTSRRFGGTGLGLAICRHLAECMQGSLTFESAPDAGSTFSLRLPLNPAPDAPEGRRSRPRCVRLVTIRPNTTQMLEAHLRSIGCTVLSEDEPGQPDLLIVEATVDPMTSLQLARAHHGATPAIVVCCRGTQAIDAATDRLGVVGMMSRPLRPSRLRELLELLDATAAPRPPVHADEHCRGRHVLVAEDTAVNRRVIAAQLARLGCIVTLAGDGEEACARFREQSFDLVLLDCQMPGVDGYAAAQCIRSTEAQTGRSRTPVLALTANIEASNREQCLAAGMDDFCTKPLRFTQLREQVLRWLPQN